MQDLLYVSFDKDEKKNEIGLCVGRPNADHSHTILKMVLDDKAETLYKILTEQEVDARPVVKGKWIKDNPIFLSRCSNCNHNAIGLHGFDEKLTDFCPNCGADMRE